MDAIVDDILRTRPADAYVVNDAKSPSGPIHVGSLRGVILHDCVARGLRDRGRSVRFLYGFDDYDPLDAVPAGAPPEWARHLGRPLADVPSPAGDGISFARHYGQAFAEVFTRLGVHPEVYWTSEWYRAGKFNDAIRIALDRADDLIQVDREISGSSRAERHPVQVLCERCGRIGTTVVIGWDGREVAYECRPDKVAWAQGCGHRGRRSPFDGGSKLQYKVEWAAKWWILQVSVEGAGKDHMTRGGSHDVASAICERIFGCRPPYPIPYEWFLVGGRKMSSSRGVGMPAQELVQILRPELARFLMVRPHHRQQINFDPGGDTIPRLYDEYDRAAAAYYQEVTPRTPAEADLLRDHARTFYYAQPDRPPPRCFRMRFSKVAYLTQMPTVDLMAAAEADKGAPLTEADREELRRRVEDARRWLQTYAPDHYRFQVQPTLPAVDLDASQREFLARLAAAIAERPRWSGEDLHARIHALKQDLGLPAPRAFSAIYLAFLGKPSGPQAGWLLASLDREFVLRRLAEASRPSSAAGAPSAARPDPPGGRSAPP
ncbi:MAG: lysine--tRNA ligase [Armatimonadota bacterium]|nr:lysine--tRNA ligase [Armatimonadota bacterium]